MVLFVWRKILPALPSSAVNWQAIFYIVSFNAMLATTDSSSVPSESRLIPKNPPTQPLPPSPKVIINDRF